MGSFREWLEEEGISGVALTSTGSVEYYDRPLHKSNSEHTLRRLMNDRNSVGFKDDEEEVRKISKRMKSQFFGDN